ncbi:MAG: Uma2 family endonuclease [Anaerolineae bacterium]|nr:Uma2 family endonuclease [Anaerolineae bacterium]
MDTMKHSLPPVKSPITERDVTNWENMDVFDHVEIEGGQWVWKRQPDQFRSEDSALIRKIQFLLSGFHGVGRYGTAHMFPPCVLDGTPDQIVTMRRPDVGFVSNQLFEKTSSGLCYQSAIMVVEIVTPACPYAKQNERAVDYLICSAEAVWLVLPDEAQIVVKSPDSNSKTYLAEDTIPVLSDLELAVYRVFEKQG